MNNGETMNNVLANHEIFLHHSNVLVSLLLAMFISTLITINLNCKVLYNIAFEDSVSQVKYFRKSKLLLV